MFLLFICQYRRFCIYQGGLLIFEGHVGRPSFLDAVLDTSTGVGELSASKKAGPMCKVDHPCPHRKRTSRHCHFSSVIFSPGIFLFIRILGVSVSYFLNVHVVKSVSCVMLLY